MLFRSDAGISAAELGMVLLVGGSTRVPAVVEEVRRITGKAVSYTHLDVYKRQVEHSAVNRVVVGSSPTRGVF